MYKLLHRALLVIFGSVFLLSAWKLWEIWSGYQQGQDSYDALSSYVSFAETAPSPTLQSDSPATGPAETQSPAETLPPAQTEPPDVSRWPQVDFAELSQINPDVIGWIYFEGTKISYPIVQGEDNDYYLDHLFDGTVNRAGCVFLDYRCAADLSDRHSIIYGHHLRDSTMFTNLVRYKYQDYYDQHPTALLVTPDAYYEIQLFSGYVANVRSDAWALNLDDITHAGWLEEIVARSRFKPNATPSEDDFIITFSTCSYEFDNAKFVLHGFVSQRIERTAQ